MNHVTFYAVFLKIKISLIDIGLPQQKSTCSALNRNGVYAFLQ